MRVLFAGSPSIAVSLLRLLCDLKGIELVGVLTNPDTSKGRHGTPQPTEVGEAAEKILLKFKEQDKKTFPVLKPLKLDASLRDHVSTLKPDLLVSFAYGRFFGPKFLSLFPFGGINIHPSLLPKYRGPTPVQAAILNGDDVTGITIQRLAQEMDSGDILATEILQLTGRETAASLSGIICEKAALMLPAVLNDIAAGKAHGIPQDHSKASFCSLIEKDDGLLDWKMIVKEIEAKIRAFDPWPLCRTIHSGRELFILKADIYDSDKMSGEPGLVLGIDKNNGILIQTGKGILAVTELQYQTKKALFWKDFLNGARDFTGSVLA